MVQEPHFGIFSTEMFEQEYKDLQFIILLWLLQ